MLNTIFVYTLILLGICRPMHFITHDKSINGLAFVLRWYYDGTNMFNYFIFVRIDFMADSMNLVAEASMRLHAPSVAASPWFL